MRVHMIMPLGVLLFLSVAFIVVQANAETTRAGNLLLHADGGVTPKKLPKTKLSPITLKLASSIKTVDGSQPPAAKTVTIDFDKQGTINAKGLAVCRQGMLEARTTAAARSVCKAAIVGYGSTSVRVQFPEQAPFSAHGPLTLFNGGVSAGVTTIFIHAYVAVPAPTALITVVKIKKIHKGHYGQHSVARIPLITGGAGSITSFTLKIHRDFTSNGKKQSYLLAHCATGRFFAHGDILFRDKTHISATVIRPCQTKG